LEPASGGGDALGRQAFRRGPALTIDPYAEVAEILKLSARIRNKMHRCKTGQPAEQLSWLRGRATVIRRPARTQVAFFRACCGFKRKFPVRGKVPHTTICDG
jgi:hypothetical protein